MTTQSPRPFLLEDAIDSDPFRQLSLWLDEAKAHGVPEHNAMVIGTVDPDGTPSTRTVLLRGLGPDGLRFFTNRLSRKGRAIAAHENVSALFPWYALERQVKVHGVAIPLDPRDDDAYFASRPWGSRIAARVSAQSQPIASRAELDAAWEAEAARYPEGGEVPRPSTGVGIGSCRVRSSFGRAVSRVDTTGWRFCEHRPTPTGGSSAASHSSR